MDIFQIDLYKLFYSLNSRYFNSSLPLSTKVEWSNRLTGSAGICYTNKKIIRLSTHYHTRHPEDIESTLIHEMIHLNVHGHGSGFYNEMARIQRLGGNVSRYSKERAVIKKPKWFYKCSNPLCRNEFYRFRKIPSGSVCAFCYSRLIGKKINEKGK